LAFALRRTRVPPIAGGWSQSVLSPDQIAAANKATDNLKSENAKAITELKAKYEDDIGQQTRK
jgi:hypothetical protein